MRQRLTTSAIDVVREPAPAPAGVVEALQAIVGPRWVKQRAAERAAYDGDALPGYRATPALVVLPASREEVVA
ncbi:hypothetical protein RZS08_03320, partial [Arthrospira platensis SPKY1]|nr:hypothetical protein [Arthrospira platensis SPKY1]